METQGSIPPDGAIAVGPLQVVTFVNSVIKVFNRNGTADNVFNVNGKLTNIESLNTFFTRWHLDHWEHMPGDPNSSELVARLESLLAALRGLPRDAEQWAARVDGAVAWNALEARRARGIAALCAGDPNRAAASLGAVWEHTQREGVHDPGAFPVAPDLVEGLVELGRTSEAIAVAERLAELAEQQPHPWGLAAAKRCRATIRLERAYDPEAGARLAEAADDCARLGLRFDHARSLLALGRSQRRQRKWGAARATLEQAAAAFDEIGSRGWAELARVGARRPAPDGELSPAERPSASEGRPSAQGWWSSA